MMITTKFDHLVNKVDLSAYAKQVAAINKSIDEKTGSGSEFLGWVDWPVNYDKNELNQIEESAEYVRNNYDVLVVCGIGGSYLGARAAIESLRGLHYSAKPEIIYMGQSFSPAYVGQLLEYLRHRKFAINVISKSGTTTETAVAFRLLRELLEKQAGLEMARKSIFATTDKTKGALLELAKKEGYVRFVLPSDIGGRYSVQTAVGLFPMACAGINVKAVLRGSADARKDFDDSDLSKNPCYQYAVARHALYSEYGKAVEFFVSYEPQFVQLGEWWKQLFGESEGKNKSGILPDSATFTTDLHSLGQFIQEGSPIFFETVLHIKHYDVDVAVPHDGANLDGLNYLEGKTLSFINDKAFEGTLEAHSAIAHNDNIVLEIDKWDDHALGYLFYFFERACAMSAYLNGVNPFNQPGVEVYKKNMFHLLGKPGY
jgi:glucose-6-phosphate isomerase